MKETKKWKEVVKACHRMKNYKMLVLNHLNSWHSCSTVKEVNKNAVFTPRRAEK